SKACPERGRRVEGDRVRGPLNCGLRIVDFRLGRKQFANLQSVFANPQSSPPSSPSPTKGGRNKKTSCLVTILQAASLATLNLGSTVSPRACFCTNSQSRIMLTEPSSL